MKKITLIAIILTMAACQKNEAPQAVQTTSISAQPADPAAHKQWEIIDPQTLDDAQKSQLVRAQEAQKALGTELVQTLTATATEKGYAAAVDFCNTEAPSIAARVAAAKHVQIGRTSDKLRNPSNKAPAWVAKATGSQRSSASVLSGPEEELGWVAPILVSEMCLNCHGPTDSLAPDVKAALAAKYPQDQATGYAQGDLRGWFWVEVPKI